MTVAVTVSGRAVNSHGSYLFFCLSWFVVFLRRRIEFSKKQSKNPLLLVDFLCCP